MGRISLSDRSLGWQQVPVYFTVGLALLLVSVAAYVGVLQEERSSSRDAFLSDHWPAVQEGASIAEAVRILGRPSYESAMAERPRASAGTSWGGGGQTPSRAGEHCERQYSWYGDSSWSELPDVMVSQSYTVCTDSAGRIRRKEQGLRYETVIY